eukprot:CAMPEP_0182439134 /NCGR_PEP_ID=MMETSP1167-20130531/86247_1 /TAXON_ID=2988 /ORGANISM="Mallomonas Sp, Strain CCMP3275" /LENGTH=544 /DNA_ID=CAMNT_0024632757 /DNA_START=687 /DNA_END=2318 /DNA_ORIENTATION=+
MVLIIIWVTVVTARLMRYQNQRTKTSLETRKAFMRYISHEIRTPLNIVIAGLKVLEEDIERNLPATELVETILDIRSSCGTAVDTLSEMLTYDKVETKKMTLDVTPILLAPFIQECLRPFYLQAGAKGVTLDVHIEANVLRYIRGDGHKLSQVIRNLVSNALKFTPTEGNVQVNVSMTQLQINNTKEECWCMDVIDSGAGISPENQKKLFKDVVQFNAGKLQAGGGTGLGLFIAKGIVDLHKGQLKVFSAGEGSGTTFTLIVPTSKLQRDNSIRSGRTGMSFFSRNYTDSDSMKEKFRLGHRMNRGRTGMSFFSRNYTDSDSMKEKFRLGHRMNRGAKVYAGGSPISPSSQRPRKSFTAKHSGRIKTVLSRALSLRKPDGSSVSRQNSLSASVRSAGATVTSGKSLRLGSCENKIFNDRSRLNGSDADHDIIITKPPSGRLVQERRASSGKDIGVAMMTKSMSHKGQSVGDVILRGNSNSNVPQYHNISDSEVSSVASRHSSVSSAASVVNVLSIPEEKYEEKEADKEVNKAPAVLIVDDSAAN